MRRRERRTIQQGHYVNSRQFRCKYNVKAVELGVPVVVIVRVESGSGCEEGNADINYWYRTQIRTGSRSRSCWGMLLTLKTWQLHFVRARSGEHAQISHQQGGRRRGKRGTTGRRAVKDRKLHYSYAPSVFRPIW